MSKSMSSRLKKHKEKVNRILHLAVMDTMQDIIDLTSPPSSDSGATASEKLVNPLQPTDNGHSAPKELIYEIPSGASRQLQINISLLNYIAGLRRLSETESSSISGLWMAEIAKIASLKDSTRGIECFLEASYEYMLWEWRYEDRTFENFRAIPFEKEYTDTIGPGVKYKVRAVAVDRLHVDGLALGRRAFEFLVEWKLKPRKTTEEPTWDEIVNELQCAKRKWVDENGLINPGAMSPISVPAGSDSIEERMNQANDCSTVDEEGLRTGLDEKGYQASARSQIIAVDD